jgi:hypothetical protein
MKILKSVKERLSGVVNKLSRKGRIIRMKSWLTKAKLAIEKGSYQEAKKHLTEAGMNCFETIGRINRIIMQKTDPKPGLVFDLSKLEQASEEISNEIAKHPALRDTLDGIIDKYIPGYKAKVVKMDNRKPGVA